jgi:hypothetical protein
LNGADNPDQRIQEDIKMFTEQTVGLSMGLLDALVTLGVVPADAAKAVWERGKFEVARIDEIERETKHDVIAFLTNLAEHVGPEARFVHQGMTSSDVLDTCLSVQLARAAPRESLSSSLLGGSSSGADALPPAAASSAASAAAASAADAPSSRAPASRPTLSSSSVSAVTPSSLASSRPSPPVDSRP